MIVNPPVFIDSTSDHSKLVLTINIDLFSEWFLVFLGMVNILHGTQRYFQHKIGETSTENEVCYRLGRLVSN